MEFTFFYIFVGLAIYAANRYLHSMQPMVKLLICIGAGSLISLIIALVFPVELTSLTKLPVMIMAVSGGLAGLILFIVDKIRFVTRSGFQYSATMIIGLFHAALTYGCYRLHNTLSKTPEPLLNHNKYQSFIIFVLIGFLIAFGYTFMTRWFKPKHNP